MLRSEFGACMNSAARIKSHVCSKYNNNKIQIDFSRGRGLVLKRGTVTLAAGMKFYSPIETIAYLLKDVSQASHLSFLRKNVLFTFPHTILAMTK